MTEINGLASFGLKDCIATNSNSFEEDFYLADAVLPQNPLGQIRVGDEAESERVHAGYFWPIESRVEKKSNLRRVPIPYAWKSLVDAGDKTVRWKIDTGISFTITQILANHISGILSKYQGDESNKQNIVAIPNHLDEFGQEALLKELGKLQINNVSFLWRPIAAALTWLEIVGEKFEEFVPSQMNDEDHIHVIYMGPDAIESTTFCLTWRQDSIGLNHIVPRRSRTKNVPKLTGFDWAGQVIEQGFDSLSHGAFWQAFTNFPEVWEALNGRKWDRTALPRPWSLSDRWTFWNPPEDLDELALSIKPGQCETLKELFAYSCPMVEQKGTFEESWFKALKSEIRNLSQAYQQGDLYGVIVCGPLAPTKETSWLYSVLEPLIKRGLNCNGNTSEPDLGKLWLCPNSAVPIAQGCEIYEKRVLEGRPTYVDTLPRIQILAASKGEYQWFDLVDGSVCEGGEIYKKLISKSFKLTKGSDNHEIYLRKDEPDLSLEEQEGYDSNFSESKKAPYRHGHIIFPYTPDKDLSLDINVTMKPASGLAKVELIPEHNEFFGKKIFDYSRMKDAYEIPRLKRGWPETIDIKVSKDTSDFVSNLIVHRFLETSIKNNNYIEILDGMKYAITSNVISVQYQQSLKVIDQNGKSSTYEANELIYKIASKLDNDFKQTNDEDIIEKIIIRGTWFWLSTPVSIVKYLEEYFDNAFSQYPARWNYFVEAASRCFSEVTQYNKLFTAIYARLNCTELNQSLFPINSARAIYRILLYRPNGVEALNSKIAQSFLLQSLSIVKKEAHKQNFKKMFFQGILLFFVLLRFRKIDQNFLNPSNSTDYQYFEELFSYLNLAEKKYRNYDPNKANRIIELREGIEKYKDFEGVQGVIQVLTELAEE